MFKKFLIGSLTYLFIGIANASPILLEDSIDHYKVTTQQYFLEDPSGKLTIEDVNELHWSTQFKKSKKGPLNFGFSKSTFWVRLKIKDLSKKKWVLTVLFPSLNKISLYKKINDKWYEKKQGNAVPLSEWEISYKDFSFYLNKKHEATYFIKVESPGVINLPISIRDSNNFKKLKRNTNFLFGIFFGILFFSVIFNLIVGFIIKSKVFFIFSFYTFSIGLLFSHITGFGRYIFPDTTFIIKGKVVLYVTTIVLISFFSFVTNFLKIKEENNYIQKLFRYFYYFLLLTPLLISFFPFHLNVTFLIFLSFLMQFINVSTGVILFKKKLEAKIYLFIFSISIISNIIQQSAFMGFLPITIFTSNALSISVLFSVTFFALIMIERFNQYKTSLFTLEYEKRNKNEAIQKVTKEDLRIIQIHVKKQTEELNMALDKLKKDHEETATFYAKFGHEMRTPLNAIIGFSAIIERNRQELSDNDLDQYINFINSSGKSLLKLVSGIQDFSLHSIGELTFLKEEVNLHKICDELESFYSGLCQQKGLLFTLEKNHSTVPKIIFLDEVRLKQVLNNLLSNSLKFTSKGHIKFTINAVKSVQNDESFDIRFDIQDTGQGIGKENLKRIFKPFSQVHKLETIEERGSGLGLDISKSIIEKMNGELLVESEEGVGSTFSILLKNVKDFKATTLKMKEEDLYAYNFSNSTVIIADDEPKNLELLIAYFKDSPLSIKIAVNGKELLEMAFDLMPDLIITDFIMPLLNADVVLKKLRKSNKTKHIPVIVVSALSLKNKNKSLFNSYLQKPLDKEILFHEMAKYIKHQKVKKTNLDGMKNTQIEPVLFNIQSKTLTQSDVALLKEIEKELTHIKNTMDINYCENFCQKMKVKINKTGLTSLNHWFDTLKNKDVSFQIDDLNKMIEDGLEKINRIKKDQK